MLLKSKPTKFLIKRALTSLMPSYYMTKKYIKNTEFFSTDQFNSLQLRNIKEILQHANNHIPYYRKLFRSVNFDPLKVRTIEDIRVIPFLTKNIYNENRNEIVSNRFPKKFIPKVYTGGTTGQPLLLYRNFGDYGRERAYTEYAYEMAGIDNRARKVYLRGKVDDENGIFHKISDFGNTLYLSSHNMKDEQLDKYVELIRQFKPKLLYTLPSVAMILAEYLQRKRIPAFESIKWLFLPSENLYEFQRKVIEEVFKSIIGTFYGHAEHAVFAIKCKNCDMYHVLPQYGYFELIDEKNQLIKEPGKIGQIVGTSFTNNISPLIRYKTGDYASYSDRECVCGKNYTILEELRGREQFLAIDKNNAKISIGPELLCTIHDRSYRKIKRFWIEQFKAGDLEIYLEINKSTKFEDASYLFKNFFQKTYPGLFNIKVNSFENGNRNNSSDKLLYFIQHVK